SESLFSNVSPRTFASSAPSLFLAARAPRAHWVALSPDPSLAIWPSRRSRRAADSSEERTGVIKVFCRRLFPWLREASRKSAVIAAGLAPRLPASPVAPTPVVGGGGQRSPASRSSSPPMPPTGK